MKRVLSLLAACLFAAPVYAQQPRISGNITTGGADCSVASRCVGLSVGSAGGVVLVEVTGTWSATVVFEISGSATGINTGTWTNITAKSYGIASGVPGASISANDTYIVPLVGGQRIRIRASAFVSGTVAINLSAASAAFAVEVLQSPTISVGSITGTLTNNNAAPTNNNVGVLPGVANASAQTWTEGRQVLSSMDLHGSTRVTILDSSGNILPVADGGNGAPTANTTRTVEASSTPFLANALSTTVVTVTGSAGVLTGYYCGNPDASNNTYVQIFDISGTVTLGTSTPKWSIMIPKGGAANLSMVDMAFANAIKVAATTTATGSTAPATAVDCNFSSR